ncbi:MAG: 30S ribosomal protein S16 [Candidatus Latescibacteria bacterium]|nr:30S ribosomal protein S16 [Candidatus Latescibacterota bacterium]
MVRLRLRRMGAKKAPFYRVVAANGTAPRDGRFIEILGHYNPTKDPQVIELNDERIQYWLGVGAQPSDTVRNLIRRQGLLKAAHEARTGSQPAEAEAEAPAEE